VGFDRVEPFPFHLLPLKY